MFFGCMYLYIYNKFVSRAEGRKTPWTHVPLAPVAAAYGMWGGAPQGARGRGATHYSSVAPQSVAPCGPDTHTALSAVADAVEIE